MGPRVAALRHRTIPRKPLIVVNVNAPQVGSSRASGKQTSEQSTSECPQKWNLSCGVFSAKVQETHAWRKVWLRFLCTFREAVKRGYSFLVIGALFLPTVACSCVEDANRYVAIEPFDS